MTLIEHPDLIEIQRELCSGAKPIVFFLGAGLSKGLGYPLWHELLTELIQYGQGVERLSNDQVEDAMALLIRGEYLACGTLLRTHLQTRLDVRLAERFSSISLPSTLGLYEKLVRLPCAGFVTTNYDTALEAAYSKVNKRPLTAFLPADVTALGAITQASPFLLKLHGDVARRSFVLSTSDYDHLMMNEALQRFLYALFFNYKIIFLGYGLSDNDLFISLTRLTHDFQGGSRRHVALLPEGRYTKTELHLLENRAGINVVSYPLSSGHRALESVVVNWVLAVEQASKRPFSLNSIEDCTELLRHHPAIILPYIRNTAVRTLEWILKLPHHWGPSPDSGPRAATTAEGLLAMLAAKEALGIPFDPGDLALQLLSFQDASGSFISKSLGTAQTQTHAVSIFALSCVAETNPAIPRALERAGNWLLRNRAIDGLGWGRFGKSERSRLIPCLWAFAALLNQGNFPEEMWSDFKLSVLKERQLGYSIDERGKSCASAGWMLWLLARLKSAGRWNCEEEQIKEIALQQLVDPRLLFLNEMERFQIDGDAAGAQHGIWVSWIHASAPAVILGCIPWLTSDAEGAWIALGKSIATVMQQASEGGDGHLKDATFEREGNPPLVFQSLYGLWALSECVKRFASKLQP